MASELFDEFHLMRETGVLWAINKYCFHPRGFALGFVTDEDGKVTGWQILGDGKEVWTFNADLDDRGFLRFESFLNKLYGNEHPPENRHIVDIGRDYSDIEVLPKFEDDDESIQDNV